jgi:hypothetical protein
LDRSRIEDEKHLQNIVNAAEELSGFEWPGDAGDPVFSGRQQDENFILEKYLVPGSGKYMLPLAYLEPSGSDRNKIILYLHTKGMGFAFEQDSLVMVLLKQGYAVLLTDLPGIGSLGPGYLKGDSFIKGISYNQWFAAVITGKSPVGLRAEDILRIIRFVRQELKSDNEISVISEGPIGVDLLHAAAFEKEIASICLIRSPLSFKNFTNTRFYHPGYVLHLVAGTAGRYDLPDLMASLIPRRILVVNPCLADDSYATNEKIREELGYPEKIYKQEKSGTNFKVWEKSNDPVEQILLWYQAQ